MRGLLLDEMRRRLKRYLKGESSLAQFQNWLIAHTWDVERSDDPEAERLTYEIELDLAEFSNGHRSETELRELLRRAILGQRLSMQPARPKPDS